jgi:hypothetical protein
MFDYLPEKGLETTRISPRLFAVRFLSSSGARLARAATRIGGEPGAALAQVLQDMVVDATVDPVHWPLNEMLAVLRRPGAQADAQVERLIANLSLLRGTIDASLA